MTILVRLSAAALLTVLCSWAALAGPIEELVGYWSGNGSISLGNGKTERVRCNVVYRADNSSEFRQSMRCASVDYSIKSLAELKLQGSRVSGTWEEQTYSAKGDVTGRFGGNSFALSIEGPSFSAAMNVTVSNCRQSLSIRPQGLEVRRVSIQLAKSRCGE